MKTMKTRLVEAVLDYLIDRNCIPYIFVDLAYAEVLGCSIPFVSESESSVTLNISANAISDFQIDENVIRFSCKVQGIRYECTVHTASIEALYGRDTQLGMQFNLANDLNDIHNEDPKIAEHLKAYTESLLNVATAELVFENMTNSDTASDTASADTGFATARSYKHLKVVK
jgi:stringent starvation protein B